MLDELRTTNYELIYLAGIEGTEGSSFRAQFYLAPTPRGGGNTVIPSAVEESIKNCHSERSEESQPQNRKSKIGNSKSKFPLTFPFFFVIFTQ